MALGFNIFAEKFCEPYFSKGRGRHVYREVLKNLMKHEWVDKTLGHAVKELMLRYNVTKEEATASLLYAMKRAMLNSNDRWMGGDLRYIGEQINKEFVEYEQYLPEELKEGLDRLSEKVKEIPSYEKKLKLMALETCAYWHKKRGVFLDSLADYVLRADNIIREKILEPLLSKTWVWVLASVFVFDVWDFAHAEDKKEKGKEKGVKLFYDPKDDTIKVEYPMFYERREFIGDVERWAWRVYDNFIEEVGRELVSASIQSLGFKLASTAIKYIANGVITLAMFHPAVRGIGTIGRAVYAVGEILEHSFLLDLCAQPFIEWKFEGWLAVHEWSILRRIRDNLAEIFQPEEYRKYFDRVVRMKEFLEWAKKYTDEIDVKDLPPQSRWMRKLKDIGFTELPSEMQGLLEEYERFCKRKSIRQEIEEIEKDVELFKNEGSFGYITRVSTLDEMHFDLKDYKGVYKKVFGFESYGCGEIYKGYGQFKDRRVIYDFKFLREEARLKTCISLQRLKA